MYNNNISLKFVISIIIIISGLYHDFDISTPITLIR